MTWSLKNKDKNLLSAVHPIPLEYSLYIKLDKFEQYFPSGTPLWHSCSVVAWKMVAVELSDLSFLTLVGQNKHQFSVFLSFSFPPL